MRSTARASLSTSDCSSPGSGVFSYFKKDALGKGLIKKAGIITRITPALNGERDRIRTC